MGHAALFSILLHAGLVEALQHGKFAKWAGPTEGVGAGASHSTGPLGQRDETHLAGPYRPFRGADTNEQSKNSGLQSSGGPGKTNFLCRITGLSEGHQELPVIFITPKVSTKLHQICHFEPSRMTNMPWLLYVTVISTNNAAVTPESSPLSTLTNHTWDHHRLRPSLAKCWHAAAGAPASCWTPGWKPRRTTYRRRLPRIRSGSLWARVPERFVTWARFGSVDCGVVPMLVMSNSDWGVSCRPGSGVERAGAVFLPKRRSPRVSSMYATSACMHA